MISKKHKKVVGILLIFLILELVIIYIPSTGGFITDSEPYVVYARYWLILSFLIFLVYYYKVLNKLFSKNIEYVKSLMEVLAIFAAGLFFLFQVYNNLLITSLELEVKSERISANANQDHLAILVLLRKSGQTSMDLHHLKGFIYDAETDSLLDFIDFNVKRYNIATFGKPIDTDIDKLKFLNRDTLVENRYTLADDDVTQFSAYKKLERKAYRIDIVAIGRRLKFFHHVNPQFRASIVSLPNEDSLSTNQKPSKIVVLASNP